MGLFGDIFKTVGGLVGGNSAAKATKKAAQLQYDAALKGIDEQARQFDVTRQDYAPYQAFGRQGVQAYGDLAGLNGADPQQAAITALRDSPLYKSLYSNGEESVLANASATGGLRGGDTKASLYHLGEDTLSNVIAQQLAAYSMPISVGAGATGAVGQFGANAVAAENEARNTGADAMAQSALLRGGLAAQGWQNAGNTLGSAFDHYFPNGIKF